MPPRSLSGEFSGITGVEAPPSYENILSVQEFEQKAANVAEQTANEPQYHDSGPADSKGKRTVTDEFEDWDDEKFARAAAAYQARLARQMEQRPHGAGSSSSANSASAINSTHRSMSPSRPGPSSQYASLPASHTSPTYQNAAQLPTPNSPPTQRGLPSRPMDQYQNTGPASPPQVPAFASVSDVKSSAPWMQSGFSDDGHGRASMDAPPPFAPIASPTSEYSEPTGIPYVDTRGAIVGDRATQAAPSAMFRNIPPPPPLNTTTLPSPPASAPAFQTSAGSPPPPPLPSSQSAPQNSYRYSEPPSATSPSANSRPPYAPQPQRRSDIPNANQRPPNFVGARPPPVEKKSFALREQPSVGSQLYASATSRAGGPTVRPDFSRIAYQSHAPVSGASNTTAHDPSAFYSSSVSSVLNRRALPPQPKRQPTTDTPTQFSQPYESNPYTAAAFYGQPAQNVNMNQGYYMQQQPLYPNQFPAPVQQQPVPPQGYPPTAAQNNWAPAPSTWQNQGRY